MSADPGSWQIPAAHPVLGARQIHIWRSRLDLPEQSVEAFRELLSSDERERAERFVFERHRRRSIVARGLLRTLLAAYTRIAPDELVFGYEPQGKPFLARPGDAALTFNLAHSDEWAVYGFTRRGRIGIDIEYHRDLHDMGQLAASVFTKRELAEWHGVPAQQRQAAFYAGWARKEAFIKALGAGLTFPLDRVSVSLAPTEPARVLHVRDDPAEALRWQLVAFSPAPDVSGAVALEGQPAEVSFWHVLWEVEAKGG